MTHFIMYTTLLFSAVCLGAAVIMTVIDFFMPLK